jgi:large subunit ribosomal protein L15
MRLHDLRPAEGAHKQKRRLGRGYGSGRGKTAGRGTKGQKARSGGKVPPWFEGGQTRLAKRLPKARGFVNRFRVEYEIVNVEDLNRFEAGATVTTETLVAIGLVKADEKRPIKVLGDGRLKRALTVRVAKVSAGARTKIEAAGGTVVDDQPAGESGDAEISASPGTEE